jgi:hypothetical protein
MDIDGKKPTFPDGVKLKTNDLLSLQTQLTNLVQALANMFSDGVISGLTIEQIGDYPTYSNGSWNYGTGSVRIHGGMAKAENGELLVIEDRQIPDIPNSVFWNQTNIGGSGRNVWIYKDDVESIKTRPDIIGSSKSVLERNVYKVAYGECPIKQPYFKLCTVNQLVPGNNISIQDSVKINYALKNLKHSDSLFNGTTYTGPKLHGSEALEILSVPGSAIMSQSIGSRHIAPGAILGVHLDHNSVGTINILDDSITEAKIYNNAVTNPKIADNSITTNKILDLNVTKSKISGKYKGQIYSVADNVLNGDKVVCKDLAGNELIFPSLVKLNVTGMVTNSDGVGHWVAWGGYIAFNGNFVPGDNTTINLYGFRMDNGNTANSGWQLVSYVIPFYPPDNNIKIYAKNNTGKPNRFCNLEVTIFS